MANSEFKALTDAQDSQVEINLSSGGPVTFFVASLNLGELKVEIPDQFIVLDAQSFPQEKAEQVMKQYADLIQRSDQDKRLIWGGSLLEASEFKSIVQQRKRKQESEELPTKRARTEELSDDDTTMDIEATPPSSSSSVEMNTTFRSAKLALFALREMTNDVFAHEKLPSKSIDMFVVSTSKILCQMKTPLNKLYPDLGKKYRRILLDLSKKYHLEGETMNVKKVLEESSDMEVVSKVHALWECIEKSGPTGMSSNNLCTRFNVDNDFITVLKRLCETGMVRKLGVNETRYVAYKHVAPWTVESFKLNRSAREKIPPENFTASSSNANRLSLIMDLSDKSNFVSKNTSKMRLLMRPWLRVEGTINRKVLDRFLGTVLGYIMLQPGKTMADLTKRFQSALSPVWVQELVEVLVELGCIITHAFRTTPCTLFSTGSFQLLEPNGLESMNELLLEPTVDAVVQLGRFIGYCKSYTKDFMV